MTYSSDSVRRAVFATLAALATTAGGIALGTGVANAAPPQTRYVATSGHDTENLCLNQADPCRTIQHAADVADPGDTVSVAGGTYDESVRIRKSLTLHGAGSSGAGHTTVDGGTGEGSDPSIWITGFQTDVQPVVTIEDVDVSGNQSDMGIQADAATTTVTDSVVSNNDSTGVEITDGTMHIEHSTVSGNGEGGVVVEDEETGGSAVIETSTLDSNVGAGLVIDGLDDSATLRKSTVSGTVPFSQNEGEPYGGGVLVLEGAAQIADSTIFGNTGQGVLSHLGDVTVDNTTISGTRPLTIGESRYPHGGVAVENQVQPLTARTKSRFAAQRHTEGTTESRVAARAPASPTTTLTGTIVADNTSLPDCDGAVVDGGFNLAGDKSCGLTATGSIQNGTAKLGPLADNGGPTHTLLPAKGSQAIDAVPLGKANCATSATDQRGAGRPKPSGGRCDIGAVEVAQTTVLISPNSLPHGKVGTPYHQTISASGGLGAPYVWAFKSGHLPPGLSFGANGVITGTPKEAGRFTFTVSVDDPTLKTYTIVITAPPSPQTSSASSLAPTSTATPIANTGANTRPITTLGVVAVGIGLLLLWAAALGGRYARRYRRAH